VLMTYPVRTEVLRKVKGLAVAEVYVEKTVCAISLNQKLVEQSKCYQSKFKLYWYCWDFFLRSDLGIGVSCFHPANRLG